MLDAFAVGNPFLRKEYTAVTKRRKKESVSVSIHFLVRSKNDDSGTPKVTKFTNDDFDFLEDKIKNQKPIDFNDQQSIDRLRFRSEIIFSNIERVDHRTIVGTFKNSYSGHAYENTHRGKIPAESVSLRPFHFLLYLSNSGRIYIGSQYLGQYGGYTSLQTTIERMLPDYGDIEARTVRSDSFNLNKAEAKEVRVTLSRHSPTIAKNNVFAQSSVLTFKKQAKADGFEEEVSQKIFPHLGRNNSEVQKVIAGVVNQNELIDVRDTDIQDCTIIARVNGKTKTIYLLDEGSFATKFPLNVALNDDGHPDFNQTKKEMLRVLAEEVISKSENV